MSSDSTNQNAVPLDEADRRLLDMLQQGIPLERRPFQGLAQRLGLAEPDILARLQRIRSQGLISRISAIFDTRSLGYESVLVAAKYRPEDLDRAAEIINQHPGVSHNYLRTAEYNLWYTLAVPPDSTLGLEKTAARLSELSHAMGYRLLPAERVFKIGVKLPLADDGADRAADETAIHLAPTEPGSLLPETVLGPAQATPTRSLDPAAAELESPCRECSKAFEITSDIKAAILALQEDLPIEPQPFDQLAALHGLDVDQLLAIGQDLLAAGVMRRYAAVLRHRKVGFGVNCMTVWSVAADRAEQVGATLAGFAEVTHCYLRPAWPDWPYNLYGMIHCRSDDQCRDLIERMKAATGIADMLAVYSTREFKKVRLQYFSPAFADWEQQH